MNKTYDKKAATGYTNLLMGLTLMIPTTYGAKDRFIVMSVFAICGLIFHILGLLHFKRTKSFNSIPKFIVRIMIFSYLEIILCIILILTLGKTPLVLIILGMITNIILIIQYFKILNCYSSSK